MDATARPDGPRRPISQWLLWVVTAALLVLAAAYLGRGFSMLLLHARPSDLTQRWAEVRWVLAGRDPYRGLARSVPYPPFAYVGLLPLVWPPWPAVRVYFAAANAVALAGMAAWAASAGRGSRVGPVLLAGSALAMAGICTTLGIGQLGVIVTGLLVAAYVAAGRGRHGWAGLLFGLALLKPTISGLFILPFLCKGRWRTFVVATAYVLSATAVVLARVRLSPVGFLHSWRQMADGGELAQGTGGLIDLLTAAGLGVKTAMVLVGVAATAATAAACVALRRRPMAVLFAVAAVGDRLWSYHTHYDNEMLLFLLVPLGAAALRTGDWRLWAAFAAVGVTLWIPARANDLPGVPLSQVAVWVTAAAVLATSSAAVTALAVPAAADEPG